MRAPPSSFAGLKQRTSPRNRSSKGKPPHLGDGSGNLPPVTRRRCGTGTGTNPQTSKPSSEFPMPDVKCQYANVRSKKFFPRHLRAERIIQEPPLTFKNLST